MNKTFTVAALFISLSVFAQTEYPDLDNLIALGEIYSKNVNATGEDFQIAVEKLRTPNLNHIIDGLIASGTGDEKLLTKEFLSKPGDQELRYWYVIREIHYNNNVSKNKDPRSNREIAIEVLQKKIDGRWLLDNYYYRIISGVARLFNASDLSKHNLDFNEFGLEDDTEKAILFCALSNALIVRFQVLQMMKNHDKLLEFASRMPSFNGKAYYEFTMFNFEDFDWIGYDKTESFKEKNLGTFYSCLVSHFAALGAKNDTEKMRALYWSSILSMPEYFKYAGKMEKELKDLYKSTRK